MLKGAFDAAWEAAAGPGSLLTLCGMIFFAGLAVRAAVVYPTVGAVLVVAATCYVAAAARSVHAQAAA